MNKVAYINDQWYEITDENASEYLLCSFDWWTPDSWVSKSNVDKVEENNGRF